uniref:Uncharacterized protein n=1 Tax=Helianthus annuus TaxID=4232 RepID=A0A251TQY9_HELAN
MCSTWLCYRTLDYPLLCGNHSESLRLSTSIQPTVSVISCEQELCEQVINQTEQTKVVNLGTRTCYLEVREWSWIEVIGLLLIDTLVLGLL